jgi:hypothetical protein
LNDIPFIIVMRGLDEYQAKGSFGYHNRVIFHWQKK